MIKFSNMGWKTKFMTIKRNGLFSERTPRDHCSNCMEKKNEKTNQKKQIKKQKNDK